MVNERCLMVRLYTLDAGQVAKDRHRGMGHVDVTGNAGNGSPSRCASP